MYTNAGQQQNVSCARFTNFTASSLDSAKCLTTSARFHFDWRSGECKEFDFVACGKGNANNFLSVEECQRNCASLVEGTYICCTVPAVTITFLFHCYGCQSVGQNGWLTGPGPVRHTRSNPCLSHAAFE